jgi:2-polyprenyl-3-methyl-5-hydroxy-6-metoxy-1,4-benzoquinol methylase
VIPPVRTAGYGSAAVAGETQKAALQRHLAELLPADGSVTVLEAGCGSYSHVAAGPAAYVVGIDISAEQLEENDHVDEKVLGDIQTHDLGEARFDMIVSWDVLEHLATPNSALERFARAARPGGLIVIAAPHVHSLKGVVARYTPFWFHVFVYRYLMALKWAGRTVRGPYPTHLRPEIAPERIASFAGARGFEVEYLAEYESWAQRRVRERLRLRGAAWRALQRAVSTLTRGRVRADISDFILVLRKNAA